MGTSSPCPERVSAPRSHAHTAASTARTQGGLLRTRSRFPTKNLNNKKKQYSLICTIQYTEETQAEYFNSKVLLSQHPQKAELKMVSSVSKEQGSSNAVVAQTERPLPRLVQTGSWPPPPAPPSSWTSQATFSDGARTAECAQGARAAGLGGPRGAKIRGI